MYNIRLEKGKRRTKVFKYILALLSISILSVSIFLVTSKEKVVKHNIVVSTNNTTAELKGGQELEKINLEKPQDPNPRELDSKKNNEHGSNKVDKHSDDKEVFLTFDDGPTTNITPEILEVLSKYDVKATFFVIGNLAKENNELIKREVREGHAVANHTYSHNYKYIYEKPENFLEDLKLAELELKNIIEGYDSKLIRFPGGSFGREPYKKAITEAGYHYVDWNALNGDAEGKKNQKPEDLVEKLKQTAKHPNHLVVLMHDAPDKKMTVQALPQIIEYLKSQGYKFKTLE